PTLNSLFVFSHSAPSGACGFSAPVAKLTLVCADTSPPSDVLHPSGMSHKKSHVGRNSKGSLERRPRDELDGAASPFKARGARASQGRQREPYRAHRAPRVPRKTLDRSSVCELAGGRACCEGAPRGRTWRRRRWLMLGKKDEQGRARQDGREASPILCSYTRRARLDQIWGDDPRDWERSCVWAQRLASASLSPSAHRGPPMSG
ncbi:hypothetical protein T492DRAFT_1018682, partial [Pavlovales sp. CCMP2436]